MTIKLQTTNEIQHTLGQRLRSQRLVQQLQQQELALRAGISLGALRKLEHDGKCSLETVIRVVQALGLTGELDTLFLLQEDSIARMQQAEKAATRQRIRRPIL